MSSAASSKQQSCPKGVDLLRNPYLNKGTAFSQAERDALSLNGFLPPKVETIEEQAARAYDIVSAKQTPVEKFDALMDIQDSNETLFFKVILELWPSSLGY